MAKKKKRKLISMIGLRKRVQSIVNSYVKVRDAKDGKFTCISCGIEKGIDQFNSGHYVPVRGREFLRYNDWNINGECIACNRGDEFHLVRYRKNLIDKIGLDAVQYLEKHEQNKTKFKREQLLEIEKQYIELLAIQ